MNIKDIIKSTAPVQSGDSKAKDLTIQKEIKENIDDSYIDYKDIKSSLKKKDNIFDWNSRDFAIHIRDLYFNTNKKSFEQSPIGISFHIPRLKDKIRDMLDMCDNIVLKDYIDFYFNKYAKRDGEGFYISCLFKKDPLVFFLQNYNYAARNNYYSSLFLSDVVTFKKLDISYKKGIKNILQEYGLVLTINFMIQGKLLEKPKVLKEVAMELVIIPTEKLALVKKASIEKGPYPNWFAFKNFKEYLDKLSVHLNNFKFDVEFIKENKKIENFKKEN